MRMVCKLHFFILSFREATTLAQGFRTRWLRG